MEPIESIDNPAALEALASFLRQFAATIERREGRLLSVERVATRIGPPPRDGCLGEWRTDLTIAVASLTPVAEATAATFYRFVDIVEADTRTALIGERVPGDVNATD